MSRRENGEKMRECDELSARAERVSAELAEVRRRAEAASADAARTDVRLRSAEAQKASLAAEVALAHPGNISVRNIALGCRVHDRIKVLQCNGGTAVR